MYPSALLRLDCTSAYLTARSVVDGAVLVGKCRLDRGADGPQGARTPDIPTPNPHNRRKSSARKHAGVASAASQRRAHTREPHMAEENWTSPPDPNVAVIRVDSPDEDSVGPTQPSQAIHAGQRCSRSGTFTEEPAYDVPVGQFRNEPDSKPTISVKRFRSSMGLLHDRVTGGSGCLSGRCGHDGLVLDGGQSAEGVLSAASVVGPFDPGQIAIRSSSRVAQVRGPGRSSAAARRSIPWQRCRRRRRLRPSSRPSRGGAGRGRTFPAAELGSPVGVHGRRRGLRRRGTGSRTRGRRGERQTRRGPGRPARASASVTGDVSHR